MNKAHGITKENLLASLPAVLANDDNMAALASAVAEVLAARVGEIERVSIYSQIDRLPNELLDILAHDVKVDVPVRLQGVMDRVAFSKILRSVLDVVEYYDAGGLATEYFGAACIGCELVDSAAAIRY